MGGLEQHYYHTAKLPTNSKEREDDIEPFKFFVNFEVHNIQWYPDTLKDFTRRYEDLVASKSFGTGLELLDAAMTELISQHWTNTVVAPTVVFVVAAMVAISQRKTK